MAMTAPMLPSTWFTGIRHIQIGTADGLHLDGEEEGAGVPGGGEEPTAQHLEYVNVVFL